MGHPLDDLTPLTWSPAEFSDVEAIYELMSGIYHLDEPTERWAQEELEESFARTGEDADQCIFVGRDQASVVALIWNNFIDYPGDRVRLAGAVHPAYRHQGIGRQILRWQRDQAWHYWQNSNGDRPLTMLAFTDQRLAGRRELYSLGGLRETRWFIDMHCLFAEMGDQIDLARELEVPGLTIVPFGPEHVEATRDCHNEAFGSVWNSAPIDEVAWAESMTRVQSRPEWSWVAVAEDGEVVGYALNSRFGEDEAEGWTDRLGVRTRWRGRGLARILLARSLDSFRTAGLDGGGLGVDSHNGGGVELYRSLGYEATDTMIEYACTAPQDL